MSFEAWLEATSYTDNRKDQLRDVKDKLDSGDFEIKKAKFRNCKSFTKLESYLGYKYARAINARPDLFKVLTGRYFKYVEKKLFSLDPFIKKIPVEDRPSFIMSRLYSEGASYAATDYTSFESHFSREIMAALEFNLYGSVLKNMHDEHMGYVPRFLFWLLAGTNRCIFSNGIAVSVSATRMSGEMNTSLGNSFSNWILMKFISEKHNLLLIDLVIEGDDCLASFHGNVPESWMFLELGFEIKVELFEDIGRASFCGLLFDSFELDLVQNPIKFILNLGWFDPIYTNASPLTRQRLLYGKCLGTLAQLPNCPMISKLCHRVVTLLSYIKCPKLPNTLSSYEREEKLRLLGKVKVAEPLVKHGTRLLVSEVFGLPESFQVLFEEWVEGWDGGDILFPPLIDFVEADHLDYWDRFVTDLSCVNSYNVSPLADMVTLGLLWNYVDVDKEE